MTVFLNIAILFYTTVKEISGCFVKQNRSMAFKTLSSNLYDVWDFVHAFVHYIKYDDLN